MDEYLNTFREMISLRGLTGHTLKGYCTYIRAYLDYLSHESGINYVIGLRPKYGTIPHPFWTFLK